MLDLVRDNQKLLGWLAVVSFVTFVGTLIVVPWLVARIPADYFVRPREVKSDFRGRHAATAIVTKTLKNFVGVVFVAAGIAMLILPGQGLLTILIGIMLIDFPGKRRFELALIRRRHVLNAVNWMRRKAGRDELIVIREADPDGVQG